MTAPVDEQAEPAAQIFLSHSADDRSAAAALAHLFEARGWTVCWNREIESGETLDRAVETRLDAARCVVVLWSKSAAESRRVRAEAENGARRGMLIPVRLEETRIPPAFRESQTADLVGWDGTEGHAAFRSLLRRVARLLEEEHRSDASVSAEKPDPKPGSSRLPAGTQLGSYRISGYLASGGMGEVYKARHTELDRWVAIKILPDDLANDSQAIQRFNRGARAASRLSHPNICTVFDCGEHAGHHFLALEYLEGETLAERISRKPKLKTTEALRIAEEVADALAHAHEHGFIHRDLKPANIMLTEDGAKVLDFGLVKRMREDTVPTDNETTASLSVTKEGMVVGTAPYMAPEQVEGAVLDARTDIFALGVVLYELLAGRRPFAGSTFAALAAAIVNASPQPLSDLNPKIPAALVRTVDRCLTKTPKDRWQTARDLAAELHWIRDSSTEFVAVENQGRGPSRRSLTILAAAAAATVLVAALSSQLWRSREAPERPQVVSFDLSPPPGVTFAGGVDSSAALSPQGDRVVFVGTDQEGTVGLWLKSVDGRTTRQLTSGKVGQPFWAPDGTSVGFFASPLLQIVSLAGGPPRALAPVSYEYRGASWGRNGTILFAPGPDTGLSRVSAVDGRVESLTEPDQSAGEIGHLWPWFLPDGRHFLYFVASNDDSVRGVYVASLSAPRGRRIVDSAASAVYASGYVLYLDGSSLMARPFDTDELTVTGQAVVIAEGVESFFTYQAVISTSTTGILAYSRAGVTEPTQLRWADSDGATIELVGEPYDQRNPALSRDGRYLAYESHRGTDSDIVLRELATGRLRRLNEPAAQAMDPVLSPDGASLAFMVERSGGSDIYRVDTNSADPPSVFFSAEAGMIPTDWSPDGTEILLTERTSRGDYDVSVLELGEDRRARKLLDGLRNELVARYSPSGDYVAYTSDDSGTYEVYLEPYPRTGARCQVSAGGGQDVHWGGTDAEIYYLSARSDLMFVDIEDAGSCTLAKPRRLFDAAVNPPGTSRNLYVVDSRNGRYLLNSKLGSSTAGRVAIVLNWPTLAAKSADQSRGQVRR